MPFLDFHRLQRPEQFRIYFLHGTREFCRSSLNLAYHIEVCRRRVFKHPGVEFLHETLFELHIARFPMLKIFNTFLLLSGHFKC